MKDQRYDRITEFMLELGSGNLNAELKPSSEKDDLDAVMVGLVMLKQELKHRFITGKEAKDKFEQAVKVLLEYAKSNFSAQMKISNDDNEAFLGLAAGINVLGSHLAKAKRELEQSNEKFHSIFQYANDAIFIIDPKTERFIEVNDRALAMLGYSREEILELSPVDIRPERNKDYSEIMAKTFLEKGEAIFEDVLERKDKTTLPVELSSRIIQYGGETVYHTFARDISERKIAHKQLESSQRKYQELYHNTPAMMHSIDAKGRIISVSSYWLEKMGYSREEVVGKLVLDFLTATSRQYAKNKMLPGFFVDGKCKNIPYQFVKRDGSVIEVLLSATSEFDESGNIIQSLAVITDVTAEKKAEKDLREREEQLRSITDNAPNFIFEINKDHEVVYMNKRGVGLAAGGKTGEIIYNFIGSPYHEKARIKINRVFQTGQAGRLESSVSNHRGERIHYFSNLGAIKDDQGRVASVIMITQDITELKRAESEIKQSNKELRLADGINRASNENKPIWDLARLTLNAYHDIATLNSSRFYLYDSSKHQLKLMNDRVDNDALEQIENKTGYRIANIVPPLKKGTFIERAIRDQQMIITSNEAEIGKILAEYTENKMLKKLADVIRKLMSIRSLGIIPLVTKNRISGLIIFSSSYVIDQSVIRCLQRFTNSITATLAKSVLENERRRLAEIVSHSNDAIMSIGLDGKVISWNKGATRLFGYGEGEILGQPISLLTPSNKLEESKGLIRNVKEGLSEANTETVLLHKDGCELDVSLSTFPLRDEQGKVKEISGIIRDISEKKEAERIRLEFTQQLECQVQERTKKLKENEEKLKEALAKEKELGELKSRFVSTASHQFRTPLAIIKSNSELLDMIAEQSNLSLRPKLTKATGRIQSEITRMTDLMDDVLILGKITSKSMTVDKQPCDLTKLCMQLALQFNSLQQDGRKVDFTFVGESRLIELDTKLISHALGNLLSNAFKYSQEGNPGLRLNYGKSSINITISDLGIGIPENELGNLFQPFHRAENVKDIAGTGLGLAIVKDYIEMNEGRIKVKSRLGIGTEFELCFGYPEMVRNRRRMNGSRIQRQSV